MSTPPSSLPAEGAVCPRCGFKLDNTSPLGLCPRCLILGIHEGRARGGILDEDEDEPAAALADEELAAELPGFELVEVIGRGGAGVVWKATERVLNRDVAVKLLHNVDRDIGFVSRFHREARIMAQLTHPNIITLYGFGRTRSNHCYLVMEMVRGLDLGSIMTRGPLEVSDALSITAEVCSALKHAHEAGFMHRDIKPGNVLLDRNGHAKVGDFGLARLSNPTDTASITRHGWMVGTPHYVAPEQARGDGLEDHRADIYSVGVILYQMLTGELPRGVFRPPSAKRKLDRRLDDIVLRALQEAPADRYQSVDEFSADLQPVREGCDPSFQSRQKATQHATRWRMALAVAVSLVIGFVIAGWVRDWMDKTPPFATASSLPDGGITVLIKDARDIAPGFRITRTVRLQPPSLSRGSFFGSGVSSSGDWLAVGAPDDWSHAGGLPGRVYLYHRDGKGQWSLSQVLRNPVPDPMQRFGNDVAMEGSVLAIAAPSRAPSASARTQVALFRATRGGMWTRSEQSLPDLPGAHFRIKLYLETGNLTVSASDETGTAKLIAAADLKAPSPKWEFANTSEPAASGQDPAPPGPRADEWAVTNSTGAGELLIHQKTDSWQQRGVLTSPAPEVVISFGHSLSLSKTLLAVGAPLHGTSGEQAGTGAVFLYEREVPADRRPAAP